MKIVVNLDIMLAKRKMKLQDLADAVGITVQNLSILKTGKAKAIRFSTLEGICYHLKCQPGDLLAFESMNVNDEGSNSFAKSEASS
jgi:putative transcriptional regulator